MSEGSSTLLVYAGGIIIIAVLWVLTILFTHWELRKKKIEDSERLLWLGMVVLLPLFGFVLYMSISWWRQFTHTGKASKPAAGEVNPLPLREKMPAHRSQATIPQADKPDTLVFTTGKILSVSRKNGKHTQPIAQNSPLVIPTTNRPFVATYSLVVLEGSQAGQEFFLNHFPVMIGRGAEAIIRLDADLHVSRKHAEIYLWEGTLFLRDLQSTGGTLLNGISLTEDQALRIGDQIKVGETVLLLQGIE